MTPMWDQRFEQLLQEHLRLQATDAAVNPGALLVDLGLDSMEAIQLLIDVEDAYGVSFPDSLLTAETFSTAGTLWEVLTGLRSV